MQVLPPSSPPHLSSASPLPSLAFFGISFSHPTLSHGCQRRRTPPIDLRPRPSQPQSGRRWPKPSSFYWFIAKKWVWNLVGWLLAVALTLEKAMPVASPMYQGGPLSREVCFSMERKPDFDCLRRKVCALICFIWLGNVILLQGRSPNFRE